MSGILGDISTSFGGGGVGGTDGFSDSSMSNELSGSGLGGRVSSTDGFGGSEGVGAGAFMGVDDLVGEAFSDGFDVSKSGFTGSLAELLDVNLTVEHLLPALTNILE